MIQHTVSVPDVLDDALPPAPHQSDELVREALFNRWSPNTLRSYQSQWRQYEEWCVQNDMAALPAHALTVARYLAERANAGASVSTLFASKAAISAAHRDAGYEDPAEHHMVRETMRGLSRQFARPQRQAAGLNADALAAIRSTALLPRRGRSGSYESKDVAERRGRLDIALCSLMSDAGLRRSEAAELRWTDIAVENDGSGRVTVVRSKTDPDAVGEVMALTPITILALLDIRPDEYDPEDRVFPLSPSSIARRIKESAIAANLAGAFSGHSGRVGCALRMTVSGAPMQAVMVQGRWKDARTVTRYTRSLAAGEALRWL